MLRVSSVSNTSSSPVRRARATSSESEGGAVRK